LKTVKKTCSIKGFPLQPQEEKIMREKKRGVQVLSTGEDHHHWIGGGDKETR